MKVAISIPDDLYRQAELVARRRGLRRSALYTNAISEFIQRHRNDDVTEQLNRVYSKIPSKLDPVLQRMQGVSVSRDEW